jgi:N6-L-threonylcarbamoyladenine synthase
MTELNPPTFPFLTLLISGGHTQLVFASSLTSFRILVDTGAIPIGNCFDKIASALKLEPDANFGLGAALERLAASKSSSGSPAVPEIPKLRPASLDGPVFELTGLVTRTFKFLSSVAPTEDKAAVHAFNLAKVSEGMKIAVVREAQRALTAALVDQTRKVVGDLRIAEEEGEKEGRGKLRELVVSGGVASNAFVRARSALESKHGNSDFC